MKQMANSLQYRHKRQVIWDFDYVQQAFLHTFFWICHCIMTICELPYLLDVCYWFYANYAAQHITPSLLCLRGYFYLSTLNPEQSVGIAAIIWHDVACRQAWTSSSVSCTEYSAIYCRPVVLGMSTESMVLNWTDKIKINVKSYLTLNILYHLNLSIRLFVKPLYMHICKIPMYNTVCDFIELHCC